MADAAKHPSAIDSIETSVPEIASSFVGRVADLAALRERFAAGARARLVTVVGPGGMGKTRLATRYARSVEDAYRAHGGGVWFCDLTPARTVSGFVAIVASTLGVELLREAGDCAADELANAIARRGRVLLVLDNAEHVTDSCAETLAAWLAAAPQCHVLATSRVAFGLREEAAWPLGPLDGNEAIELFVGRARQVRPELVAQEADRPIIAKIVTALDAMPLAIELAASRTAVLSLSELLSRLDRPLDLLAGRPEGGRHSSVRRAVLDSVSELTSAQRDGFEACAVFHDGFALDAAEAVLDKRALAAIEALVHRSLLRMTTNSGGQARFRSFETIREVAGELLAESPLRATWRNRHAAFYASLAERLGRDAAVGDGAALVHLGLELENIIAAHEHAVASPHEVTAAHRAVATAVGLDPVLAARGLSRLRIALLDRTIACVRDAPDRDSSKLADALVARGAAARELGELIAARADLEAGLACAEEAGSAPLAALAEGWLGELIEVTGRTSEAHGRFARALERLATVPHSKMRTLREAETYMRIGHAHRREGGLAHAEVAIAEAVARYRQLGQNGGLAAAIYEAAVIAMFQGRGDVALARFDEGLEIAARVPARAIAGALTTARGGLLQEMGDLDAAVAHHAEAARVFRELGSRHREASALYYLATAYFERGDTSEGMCFLDEARGRIEGLGVPHYEALIEGCRAISLSAIGDRAAAAEAMARAKIAQATCATERALAATITIHQRFLEVRAVPSVDEDARVEAERSARALVDANPSDDSRFALRALVGALHPVPPRARPVLRIWGDARAFQPPGAASSIDLTRRAPLRRIVTLLARRRIEAPGKAVSLDDIVGAGWPGERMDAQAASNRAYVALATLRKLGLRDLIVSGEGGYCLDPAIPLDRVTDAPAIKRD